MNNRIQLAVLLAGTTLLACAHLPQTHYYLFDYSVDLTAPGTRSAYILGVANIIIDAPYDQDRLVYRQSDNEVEYYHYHRWVAPPQELIWQRLCADLTESRLFDRVVRYPGYADVDFFLTAHILHLEERDEGENWFACLDMQVTLYDAHKDKALQRINFDERLPLEDKTPLGVVIALNTALQRCSASIIESLKDILQHE